MATGPSKEELEMYWKSSRQYFDELAKYYKTADPEYYDVYIGPYYRFRPAPTGAGGRSASPVLTTIISLIILLIGLIAGIFMLLLG